MKKQSREHKSWQYFLLAFQSLLALASVQRISFNTFFSETAITLSLYLHEIVCIVFICYALSQERTRTRLYALLTTHRLLGVLFAWVGIMTVLSTGHPLTTGILYWFRLGFYLLSALVFQITLARKKSSLTRYLSFFFATYLSVSLMLYLLFPDMRFMKILGWDDHYYRLIGTIFDPNFSGTILALANIWFIEKLLATRSIGITRKKPQVTHLTNCEQKAALNRSHRTSVPYSQNQQTHQSTEQKRVTLFDTTWAKQKALLIASILTVIALGLTFSRSSFLAWWIGLVYVSFKNRKKPIAILTVPTGAIILLLTLLLAPKPGGEGVNISRTSSALARLETAQAHISEPKPLRHILLGSGFAFPAKSTHPLYNNDQHAVFPDNFFILLYSSIGVAGIGYLIFLLWYYRSSIRRYPQLYPYLGILLTHSMFNNTMLQPIMLIIFLELIIVEIKRQTQTTSTQNP